MDIDELRRLIRAAVLAMPIAGCAASPAPAPEAPPPSEPVASRPAEPTTTTPTEPTTAPSYAGDGEMDPEEFERQWRASTRGGDSPSGPGIPIGRGGSLPPGQPPQVMEGRPLMAADAPVHAALDARRSWAEEVPALGLELSAPLRERVAARWCESALAEHASVASFARAALELMAVGAPASLIDAHLEAGRDELRHAELCFSIAAAYGAPAHGPGALEVPPPRGGGLEAIVRDVFREGCVNESIAALAAQEAARLAEPEPVRSALSVIAEDEARHAALAWQTVRWTLSRDAWLRAVLTDELARLASGEADAPPDEDADALAAAGVLDPATLAAARGQALELLVRPLAEELCA